MKNLLFMIICLAMVFAACNKLGKNSHSDNIISEESVNKKLGFPFPEGTILSENYASNGEVESIHFQLPNESIMYGITSDDRIISSGNGTITCNCDSKGSCKPFYAGSTWGCLFDGCTKCNGSVSSMATNNDVDMFFIKRGELGIGALMYFGKARPITEVEEWMELPFITTEDFNDPKVQKAIEDLKGYITEDGIDSKQMVAIPYMIEGKKMLVDVPYNLVVDGMIYTAEAGSGNISCSGSCSKGKCIKVSYGMGIYYCDGCSSGCSLTSSSK